MSRISPHGTLRAAVGVVGLLVSSAAGCRAPEAAADGAAPASTIVVVLGPAGARSRYTAGSRSTICGRGYAGPESWTVQYTDTRTDTGLASLQLVVPRGAESPAGSDSLHLGIAIGTTPDDSGHVVETRAGAGMPRGRGHVEVRGGPDTAVIVARGEAGSGTLVEATIRCARVRRAGTGRSAGGAP
jgi:hypothetical protein